MAHHGQLRRTLQELFGFDDFRPGQLPVVEAVLSGRPTLAVMPTGAGKSLCYQLPAIILPGTALVVSPLVALMKDQVDALVRRGVPAAFVSAAQPESERQQSERDLAEGRLRLVYVAPERFRSPVFMRALTAARLSLVAVDEAHCVSEWGHAFRPDYERLGDVLSQLAPTRLLALTATAGPEIRGEIVRLLRMQQPRIEVAGFDRPNIHLEVHELSTEAEKFDTVLAAVREHSPAIVYSATRRQAETLAIRLARLGVSAAAYHAGLTGRQRTQTQEAFQSGHLRVVVATNAFGLGVDKSDVRLVVHSELPRSIEAFYQEAGRAGRDGLPSIAALLFAPKDIFLQKHLVRAANPAVGTVEQLWSLLEGRGDPVAQGELARRWPPDLPSYDLSAGLAFLESAGLIVRGVPGRGLSLRVSDGVDKDGTTGVAELRRRMGGSTGVLEESVVATVLGCESKSKLYRTLTVLQREGLISFDGGVPVGSSARGPGAQLRREHLQRLADRRRHDLARLEQVIRF